MTLNEKVALITGASRRPGLGLSIALGLARAGAHIALCGLSQRDILEENAAEVRALGVSVTTYLTDVTDHRKVQAMVAGLVEKHGAVDILVNGAGSRGDVGILDMTAEQWRAVMAVNLDGAFNCVKAVAPGMAARNFGRIINLAGIAGQAGEPQRAHVVTAKAGIIGFTKGVAADLGRYGITVNAISPGLIDTPRPEGAALDRRRRRITESPLGRAGSGADIANACVFLASQEASFITGQTLSVNGGAFMA